MKRAKSIAVASILTASMLASSVVGFAADYDLKHKTDPAKNTKILTILKKANRDQFKEVARNMKDYYIEYGGKDFELKAYDAKWTEAVSKHPDLVKDGKITEKMIFGFEPMPAEATIAPLAPSVQEFEVTEISAISPRAFRVNFNRAVTAEEEAKLTFEVKKGGVAHAVTVKVAADKKSAVLERGADFVNGKYEVAVKLDGKEVLKKEIEIKAEEASSIVIHSDKFEKDANAALDVEILNQYKEELAASNPVADLSVIAVNKTEPGRKVTPANATSYDTTKCEIGDEIEITLIHKTNSSVKVTKVVTVGYVATQGVEVSFGEVKMDGEKTEINPGDTITLPFTVKKNGKEVLPDADQNIGAPGANLNTAFTNDSLLVFYDNGIFATLGYKKAEKAFVATVNGAAKPGVYEVKLVNDKAVEYKMTFEVKKAEEPARVEPAAASVKAETGKPVEMAFKLIGDRGNELKWADFPGYEIAHVSKDPAGAAITWNTFADGVAKYNNAAEAKITVKLMKGANEIEGGRAVFNVEVTAALASFGVSFEKPGNLELKSGDTFKVVVEAKDAGLALIPDYTGKVVVDVKYGGGGGDNIKVLNQTLNFSNGKAILELPAFKTAAGTLTVESGVITGATAATIEVSVGDPAGLKLTPKDGGDNKKMKVTIVDGEGNTAAVGGDQILTVLFDDAAGQETNPERDALKQVKVAFTAGEGAITFTNDLTGGEVYTVKLVIDGKTIEKEVTVS